VALVTARDTHIQTHCFPISLSRTGRTCAAKLGIGSVDTMKELIPVRNGYNSEASCLQSMPQGLALFEAGLGYRLPQILNKYQKNSVRTSPWQCNCSLPGQQSSSELALLVLGAYMIMLTNVVARECKCLYVSVVALAPQNYNRYSKVFVKELRAHHHSGHTGSNRALSCVHYTTQALVHTTHGCCYLTSVSSDAESRK
jgi:hypothetical protein